MSSQPSPAVVHPSGRYRYVPGIEPYSGGVRAAAGHQLVHVTLRQAVPWAEGFALIDHHLAEAGVGPSSLCSIALRCPEPHSFDGFIGFNGAYRGALIDRQLLLDGGVNPIARTNVAPVVAPPAETVLYSFGYVADEADPAGGVGADPSFVIAGAGDLRDQADLTPAAIVAAGARWVEAGEERATVVLDEMESRMAALEVTWAEASQVNVYCAEPIHAVLEPVILARMGPMAAHGVHWHLAAPPIAGLTFEMDLRGGTAERWL